MPVIVPVFGDQFNFALITKTLKIGAVAIIDDNDCSSINTAIMYVNVNYNTLKKNVNNVAAKLHLEQETCKDNIIKWAISLQPKLKMSHKPNVLNHTIQLN